MIIIYIHATIKVLKFFFKKTVTILHFFFNLTEIRKKFEEITQH